MSIEIRLLDAAGELIEACPNIAAAYAGLAWTHGDQHCRWHDGHRRLWRRFRMPDGDSFACGNNVAKLEIE